MLSYTYEDGTIEEFEVETERDLDIEQDTQYLESAVAVFRHKAQVSEESESNNLLSQVQTINMIVSEQKQA